MGQKVNPIGFRLGSFRSWSARWFSKKADFGKMLLEDFKIRRFVHSNISRSDFSEVVIERTSDDIRLTLHSCRPGLIIGKKGQGIEDLKKTLSKEFGKNFEISVKEVKNPDIHASIVANAIAEKIEKRVSYKKVMKRAGFSTIKAGARGIRICVSGRLAGAEIARKEFFRHGSVPLHTMRYDVDYALAKAQTTYGIIGVKVWISRGEF